MAEIRCPMCGKSNHEDLEVCQFCQARIKPMRPGSHQDEPLPGDSTPSQAEQPQEPAEDQDWLGQMRLDAELEDTPEPGPEASSEQEEITENGTDDWLQRIRAIHQENLAESGSGQDSPKVQPFVSSGEDEAQALDDNDLPDWFSQLRSLQPSPEEETSDDSPEVGDPFPDWIKDTDSLGESEASQEDDVGDASTPDWLKADQEPSLADQATDAVEELTTWISEAEKAPPRATPSEPSGPDEGAERLSELQTARLKDDSLSQESSSPGEEDLQSWFSELDKEEPPEVEFEPDDSDEEMPGWLKNLGSVVTGTVEDNARPDISVEDSTPFIGQEEFDEDLLDVESLPAWLTPESMAPEEESDEPGLAAAELPSWLEVMRPMEPVESGISIENGPIESSGPLAGLRAVLPAEPEVNRYTKPPLYSTRLRVTNNQLAQADLIQKILAGEGQTRPIPAPPRVSSQGALRWLIALILSIVIGFVVIGSSNFVPMPDRGTIPTATYNASRVITGLPDQARVLLAFDYEPGTAGELHAAAAPLVDHLMLKSARLTLVSTLTTGPAMAEYFVQEIQSQHHYTSSNQYINLGYIPGGATGLHSFVQNPQWLFPQSYKGYIAWDTPPLQDITSLADFDLVVVLSDDSDTARLWIEQVQPALQGTPFLAILSARAEPLVRPYYGDTPESQVQGIVSGIGGGVAYEAIMGQTNLGRTYWDAYTASLVIAVAAILIGGIVTLVQTYLTQRHREHQGEEI